MANRRFITIAVATLALLGALAFVWLDRSFSFFKWDPPRPGTVVAESESPNRNVAATVRAATPGGHYVFELRTRQTGQVIATRDIAAPVGYHPHIVTLEWDSEGKRAVAIIDHDFGDNNLRFALGP
jgi:hypothetical protein